MKRYGGIDLHSNNSVVVLQDENDAVVYRRRLPNTIDVILSELAPFADAIDGMVVESTDNGYWLVDGLMEAGYRVHLANTAAIGQYSGLSNMPTTTRTPAGWLSGCASGSCQRAVSTRRASARCVTSCASAVRWSISTLPTCSRSRVSWRVTSVSRSVPARSGG
jgi:hypothetical protein